MALKFFFTYLGVLLACSVTLAVVVKQLAAGFAANGRKPFVYGAFSSFIASGAAYLSTLILNHLFIVFWFLAAIYFLFGVIHVSLVHKKYFYAEAQDKVSVILGEIIFGFSIIFFSILIFSTLQYFISSKNFLFYPMMMSTITFFIPFLFLQTFEAAYSIPSASFKTWEYPLHQRIDIPDEKPGEKLLVIGFEIAKKPSDIKKTYFRAKAPETMVLGELYYHFINDYNQVQSESTIDYAEGGYGPHKWWFRRKPGWYQGQRILDPEMSVRENGITENTVIVCERIKGLS